MNDEDSLPDAVANAINELKEHYQDFEKITKGANGILYFAKNIVSLSDVAIKFYAGEPGEKRHDEPRQLSALTCPNVLTILEARSISDEWAFFVTPRSLEGDLDDVIESRPSVHTALDIAVSICSGVSSIHAAGMIHRDLKPANIVIQNMTPRIADFGSVSTVETGQDDVPASKHSILWRPPESFDTDRYSRKGDVYQIGVVTYQLLGGRLNYDGLEYLSKKEQGEYAAIDDQVDKCIFVDGVIQRKASTGKLIDMSSLPGWLDIRCRKSIKEMCNPDPNERLGSVADIAARLTSMRSNISDWKWNGEIAVLEKKGSAIELRPADNNKEYVAYKNVGSGFRRIPKLRDDALSKLCSITGARS